MSIRETICPLCGNPSPEGGICARCRAAETRWLECPQRIGVVFCPTCGARKEAGTWSDSGSSRDDLLHELAARAVRLHAELKDVSTEVSCEDISPNRSRAHCHVSGTLFGVPVEGSCTIEIVWQKEQCDRCCRISGSYYEGVVQVRAVGRKITPREIGEAARIARGVEESMMASGERLSFISDVDEHRDGLDITVGSQRLGQEISSAIVRSMGGRVSTHPKLVGEKAGRQVFRITWSLRLPRYSRGDIVLVSGRYAEVMSVEGKTLRYCDLASGAVRNTSEGQVERRAGHRGDAAEWMVAFRDGDLLGVLDPATGVTREIREPRGRHAAPGEMVRVLEDGEHLVLLR